MGVHILNPKSMTFIHLKKTGGTSVSNWLMNNLESGDRFRFNKHASLDWARSQIKELGYTFTVVRNPYAREVSFYHYIIKKAENRLIRLKNKSACEKLKKEANYCRLVLEHYKPMGFKKYTMTVPHLDPQMCFIRNIDHIIKLENLKEDIKVIKKELNITNPIPHINKSNHFSYRSYYDEELKEFVYQKHKEDFDFLGYKFD